MYVHECVDIVTKESHSIPNVDPIVASITSFVVYVGFNQIKGEDGTIEHLDPKSRVIRFVALSSIYIGGNRRRCAGR